MSHHKCLGEQGGEQELILGFFSFPQKFQLGFLGVDRDAFLGRLLSKPFLWTHFFLPI